MIVALLLAYLLYDPRYHYLTYFMFRRFVVHTQYNKEDLCIILTIKGVCHLKVLR